MASYPALPGCHGAAERTLACCTARAAGNCGLDHVSCLRPPHWPKACGSRDWSHGEGPCDMGFAVCFGFWLGSCIQVRYGQVTWDQEIYIHNSFHAVRHHIVAASPCMGTGTDYRIISTLNLQAQEQGLRPLQLVAEQTASRLKPVSMFDLHWLRSPCSSTLIVKSHELPLMHEP